MAVRADQCLAGNTEALQVYLMADAVARTGKPDTMLLGYAADKPVIISILKTILQCIVVDVCHGKLCFDSGYPHCLVFQISHCSRSILCQRLVDAQTDLGTLDQFTVHDVCLQDLFG